MTPPTGLDDRPGWSVADGLDTLTSTCTESGCVGGVMTPPYRENLDNVATRKGDISPFRDVMTVFCYAFPL